MGVFYVTVGAIYLWFGVVSLKSEKQCAKDISLSTVYLFAGIALLSVDF